jgi:hypothetical protein
MRKFTFEEQGEINKLILKIELFADKYKMTFKEVIEKLKNPYGRQKNE